MNFTLANADMDGGLENPPIAIALAALVFGAWMVFVLRSPRPILRKSLMLMAVFALAFPGAHIAMIIARIILVALNSQPGVQVGFIGRPPQFLAPTAAVILALVFHGASVLWRRLRPSAPPA